MYIRRRQPPSHLDFASAALLAVKASVSDFAPGSPSWPSPALLHMSSDLSTYHSPGPSRVFGSLSWPSLIARRKPLRGFLFLLFPSVLAGAGVSLAIMTVEGHDSGGEWRTTDCRRSIDGSVLLCHQQAPDEMIGRW